VQSSTSTRSTATTTDYAYPRGHLGHLNAREAEAFEQFKALLKERGAWTPGPPPSHDDPLLLYVPDTAHSSLPPTSSAS
jgi:hypothetical protein